MDEFINGYVERKPGGKYEGAISIDGIHLPAIVATYFTKDHKNYLWLRRKDILEYDYETSSYRTRKAKPQWEAYLEKQVDRNVVAYKGSFIFMRFKYSIVGVWDNVLGKENNRLNLYVERMPLNEQTILKGINQRKIANENGK